MDERPSFRNLTDVLQLVGALVLPWIILGFTYVPVLLIRQSPRFDRESANTTGGMIQYWYFGSLSLVVMITIGFCVLGIWRLIRRKEYRHSLFGLLWSPILFSNLGLIGSVIGH